MTGAGRTTFDVHVWAIREIKNRASVSWQVRWQVTGRPRPNSRRFPHWEAARARHAEIFTAVNKGQAFDVETGLPVAELRSRPQQAAATVTWLHVAQAFTDAKWAEHQAPGSRRSIAEALGAVTVALFDTAPPARLAELVREALSGWSFNTGTRTAEKTVPPGWGEVVGWMEKHSRPIRDLADEDVLRAALAAAGLRIDGKVAAANTQIRRRQVFGMALDYAVARGHLTRNPIGAVQWKPPKKLVQVDRRVVVNRRQGHALLDAAGRRAPELKAWFACIYEAAMRPGEVNELREDQLTLPEAGWGEALLAKNNPEISPLWADEDTREGRELKHRARGETRLVPLPPALVALLRAHITVYGVAPDGRIFRTRGGGPIKATRYLKVWREARKTTLTATEVASPLARRPYDLRHACVSGWVNAGVPVTQAAEWAGHSVRVLLMVYAKCIVGQGDVARRRLDAAFAEEDNKDET